MIHHATKDKVAIVTGGGGIGKAYAHGCQGRREGRRRRYSGSRGVSPRTSQAAGEAGRRCNVENSAMAGYVEALAASISWSTTPGFTRH
jgi:NAD(P)-dependent dehydrogenase (short-subunit alcohol dehydrogenase family)